MKQLIILVFFLAKTLVGISQYTDSLDGLSAERYLVKSRNQKGGAVLLTIVGSIGLLATVISDMSQKTDDSGLINLVGFFSTPGGYTPPPEPASKRKSYVVPYLLSAAAIVGAIPLYVGAAQNKNTHYMLSAHVKFEERTVLQRNTINPITYPALFLKLQLK